MFPKSYRQTYYYNTCDSELSCPYCMEVGADEEVYMFKCVFQLKSVVIYRYTESLGYLNCKADRCIAFWNIYRKRGINLPTFLAFENFSGSPHWRILKFLLCWPTRAKQKCQKQWPSIYYPAWGLPIQQRRKAFCRDRGHFVHKCEQSYINDQWCSVINHCSNN